MSCDRGYTVYRDDENGKICIAMHLESEAFSVTAVAVSANVAIHSNVSKLTSNDAKLSGMACSLREKCVVSV